MIIHNPTETAVRDYPIQDPKTGDVSLWSIEPGQTLDFPDYAGKYLVEVYAFLQRIVTKEQLAAEKQAEQRLSQGQHFSQVKVIDNGEPGVTNADLQTPPATLEDLQPKNPQLTPPALQPAMAGAIEGDEADKVSEQVQQAQPASVPTVREPAAPKAGKHVCPECKEGYQNEAALKTHYAHKHLVLPK